MGLLKTQNYLETEPALRNLFLANLNKIGLSFENKVKVRHPLDVLTNDIGLDAIRTAVFEPLKGLKVVSYYGCQL